MLISNLIATGLLVGGTVGCAWLVATARSHRRGVGVIKPLVFTGDEPLVRQPEPRVLDVDQSWLYDRPAPTRRLRASPAPGASSGVGDDGSLATTVAVVESVIDASSSFDSTSSSDFSGGGGDFGGGGSDSSW